MRAETVQADLSFKVGFRFGLLEFENGLAFLLCSLENMCPHSTVSMGQTQTRHTHLLMEDSNDLDSRNIAGSHYLH